MKRIKRVEVQKLVFAAVHGKWFKNILSVMYGYSFVVVATIVGFLIAVTSPVLFVEDKADGPAPKTSVSSNKSTTEQTDPNFAKYPAWAEDYSKAANGQFRSEYWSILYGPAQNGNKELQYYTNKTSNIRVENGALRLIALKEAGPGGYQYSSSRIETSGKKTFKYGRIDIVAKLPSGTGTWPAIWMLPANDYYAQKSPESFKFRYKNGGEIDIVEAVGHQQNVVYGVAHSVADLSRTSEGVGSHGAVMVVDADKDFNKYSLMWTPTSLTYAVNDQVFYTYKKENGADYTTWPFDQPFYMIINLAVGGTWGGMDTAHYPGTGVDDSALPASLDIKSINYYPYKK